MCLQTPVELVNSFLGPSPETMIHWVRLGQWICISNQLTNDGRAADPRTKIWELLLYLKLTFKKLHELTVKQTHRLEEGWIVSLGFANTNYLYIRWINKVRLKMDKQGPWLKMVIGKLEIIYWNIKDSQGGQQRLSNQLQGRQEGKSTANDSTYIYIVTDSPASGEFPLLFLNKLHWLRT